MGQKAWIPERCVIGPGLPSPNLFSLRNPIFAAALDIAVGVTIDITVGVTIDITVGVTMFWGLSGLLASFVVM